MLTAACVVPAVAPSLPPVWCLRQHPHCSLCGACGSTQARQRALGNEASTMVAAKLRPWSQRSFECCRNFEYSPGFAARALEISPQAYSKLRCESNISLRAYSKLWCECARAYLYLRVRSHRSFKHACNETSSKLRARSQ